MTDLERSKTPYTESEKSERIYRLEKVIKRQDAEIRRLQAALEDIAYPNPLHNEDNLMGIARAALEGE